MNKTKMIFVRHGQSEANLAGIFIGHINSPLTELGHRQAELTAEFLKDEHIDVFYGSDLIRAYETGRHIAKRHNKGVIPDKNLREIFAGDWEGKKFSELYERITGEVKKIARENMGKTVLIATHATPIRCLVCLFKGIDPANMKEVPWVHNASVTEADFYEDGSVAPIIIDKFDFMGEMATALPKNV